MTEPHGPAGNGTDPAAAAEPLADRLERGFTADGVEWIAYSSGKGAYGTGRFGLAALQSVHFARLDEPAVPVFEALLPAGRFAGLFESELVELFRGARRIVIPQEGSAPAARRFTLEEDLS